MKKKNDLHGSGHIGNGIWFIFIFGYFSTYLNKLQLMTFSEESKEGFVVCFVMFVDQQIWKVMLLPSKETLYLLTYPM